MLVISPSVSARSCRRSARQRGVKERGLGRRQRGLDQDYGLSGGHPPSAQVAERERQRLPGFGEPPGIEVGGGPAEMGVDVVQRRAVLAGQQHERVEPFGAGRTGPRQQEIERAAELDAPSGSAGSGVGGKALNRASVRA